MVYRVLRILFHWSLRVFFRRMEVDGLENIPESGPVLFLPNHINALVDALVVLEYVKRPVSLTAKSTLAEYKVVDFMMRSARVIRFHRKQDKELGADRSRNVRALAECRRRLEQGEAICIFPEGQSHSDPGLRPFRWGAARLALEYSLSNTSAESLKLVPVGLHFPGKGRFRSDVWVRFGEPIDVDRWIAANPDGGPKELTDELERGVRKLTVDFEQREDSILLNWAADVLSTGGVPPMRVGRQKGTVAARLSLVKLMKDRYDLLKDVRNREVEDLRMRMDRYRTKLRQLGLAPAEVYIHMETWRAALFVLREMGILLFGLPMAAWGTLNHYVPYQIVRLFALKFSKEKDQMATNVVFPGIVIFPFFYTAQIVAAWLLLPHFWAGIYTVSLPFSAYFTLLYMDRMRGTLLRVRAFTRFLRQPELQARLILEGRSIIEDLEQLGEDLEP